MQKFLDGLVKGDRECGGEHGHPIPILSGLSIIKPAQKTLAVGMCSICPLQLVWIQPKLCSQNKGSIPATFEAHMTPTVASSKRSPWLALVFATQAAHCGRGGQGDIAARRGASSSPQEFRGRFAGAGETGVG